MKVNKLSKVLIVFIVILFVTVGSLSCVKQYPEIENNELNIIIQDEIKEKDLGNNMASGSLSAGTVTTTTINVNYAFTGCPPKYNVLLLMNDMAIKNIGMVSGSGSYTETGLNPNTNYTFEILSYCPGGFTILASKNIKTSTE